MRHESTNEATTAQPCVGSSGGLYRSPHDAAEAGDGQGGGGPMRVGSLFSGIGGLDLGFHRAGFEIAWMCEKDEFCRKVLHKHWPEVPIYDDVTTLRNPPAVDVLIGGFPCQDVSKANREGRGLDGERSGLWWEMHRLVRDLRPRYVVVENVANLLVRGLDAVLGSLAELGYDAEWETLPASAFGAPHGRDRLFLVAYADGDGREPAHARERRAVRDEHRHRSAAQRERHHVESRAHASGSARRGAGGWPTEPKVARLADGVPGQRELIRAFGNAVVPQVAEYVARCVRKHAEARGEWGHRHDAPTMKAAV